MDIFQAAADGDVGAMQAVLGAGADVDARNSNGLTPLMLAALNGRYDCAKLLVEAGADVDARSDDGLTALMAAAGRDEVDIMTLLVQSNADVEVKDRVNGFSALVGAAWEGHTDSVELLIAAGADVNAKANADRTALMAASSKGFTAIVKLLIDAGANLSAKETQAGYTALDAAERGGHADIVRILQEAAAKGVGPAAIPPSPSAGPATQLPPLTQLPAPTRVVAAFNETTGWSGRAISLEGDQLVLQDHGPITASAALEYDRRGQLAWHEPAVRDWAERRADYDQGPQAAGEPVARSVPARAEESAAPPLRMLRFPDDRSLGYLAARNVAMNDAYRSRIEARGAFPVPSSWSIGVALWVDPEDVGDLAPLTALGPEDLQALHLHDPSGVGEKRPGGNDAQLAHLRTLTGLAELDLHYTKIGATGLAHVAALTGLEKLRLDNEHHSWDEHQEFDEGLTQLVTLTRLRDLDVNHISGLGLSHISHLSSLQALLLGGSSIDDKEIAVLADLPRLERLELLYLQHLGDAGLAQVGALSGLRELALRNLRVTDDGLAHLGKLTRLERLALTQLDVTDDGLAHLSELVNLRQVRLSGDALTARIDWLRSTLPGVEIDQGYEL